MNVTLILAAGCALIAFFLIMGLVALLRSSRDEADDKIKDRLRELALNEADAETINLVRKQSSMSDVAWFNRILEKLSFASNLRKTIQQGNAKGSAGIYLLMCALLGILGAYIGFGLAKQPVAAIIITGSFAYLPLFYLKRLKNKRMGQFQQQLPEALDLMSRALKAGHTFGGSMRMVADEFIDPIGGEFRITLDEINYGMDVDRALGNLQERVDVSDLKFFVVSVNIQRETGGNLAEIISNIAHLVRERFVLFGKIKVLSAEGRISAIMLSALPFAVAGVLYFINPEYMSLLWTTEIGRTMAWGAVISMFIGIVSMRRMVKIKV